VGGICIQRSGKCKVLRFFEGAACDVDDDHRAVENEEPCFFYFSWQVLNNSDCNPLERRSNLCAGGGRGQRPQPTGGQRSQVIYSQPQKAIGSPRTAALGIDWQPWELDVLPNGPLVASRWPLSDGRARHRHPPCPCPGRPRRPRASVVCVCRLSSSVVCRSQGPDFPK
jgi:hypothetical protein